MNLICKKIYIFLILIFLWENSAAFYENDMGIACEKSDIYVQQLYILNLGFALLLGVKYTFDNGDDVFSIFNISTKFRIII